VDESVRAFAIVDKPTKHMEPFFDRATSSVKKELPKFLKSLWATEIKISKGKFYVRASFHCHGNDYALSIGDYLLSEEAPYAVIERKGYSGVTKEKIKVPLNNPERFTEGVREFIQKD